MLATASAVYYYCLIPRNIRKNPKVNSIITSNNICDILFLQKMFKFESDIVIAHRDWEMDDVEVFDISDICYSQEYRDNGNTAFNFIIESLPIRLGLFWDREIAIKTYRRYYRGFYEDYYNKLSNAKKKNPPKAIFYNAFSKMVNEFINIEKQHGNIVLTPSR